MWFIGVGVEQETSAPPSNKNPGSATAMKHLGVLKNSFKRVCAFQIKFQFEGVGF